MTAHGYRKHVTHEMIARSRARTHAALADLAGHEDHVHDPMIAAARAMDRTEQAVSDTIDEFEWCLQALGRSQ